MLRIMSLRARAPPSTAAALFSTAAPAAASSQHHHHQHEHETFLTGTSSVYVEHMHERYTLDRTAVPRSWQHYFDGLAQGRPFDASDYTQPTTAIATATSTANNSANSSASLSNYNNTNVASSSTNTGGPPSDSLGVAHLIRAYQVNGHLAARLDPLDLYAPESFPYRSNSAASNSSSSSNSNSADADAVPITTGNPSTDPDDTLLGPHAPPDLAPSHHGFGAADWDRPLQLRGTSTGGAKGYLEALALRNASAAVTLRTIVSELRKTYTSTLGVEYMVRNGCVCVCVWPATVWIGRLFRLLTHSLPFFCYIHIYILLFDSTLATRTR